METRTGRRNRQTGAGARGTAGVMVIALAGPLHCLEPLLLAGLAATGYAAPRR